MKTRQIVIVLGTLLLMATFALAQSQDVKITKGPTVESTSGDSAIVAWSTNVSASTVVKYGTDRNNLDKTAQAPWGGLTHRVTLKNLEPNKTYYYQVTSGQGAGTGTGALSAISQFNTQNQSASNSNSGSNNASNQDKNQFKITNGPNIEGVSEHSAMIAWSTDRPSSSIVKYGKDANNLDKTAQEPWGATTHRVKLNNLEPGTQYYFEVQSAQGLNAPGQRAETQTQSFTTRGGNQSASAGNKNFRITNGPVIEHVADTSAVVAFSTDRPSSTIVKYGTDPNNLSQTAQEPWGATTHRVELKNLKPSTQYYVQVQSAQGKNAPGQKAESQTVPFTTAAQGQQASADQR
ncbi:MAG TPA: fibronectin type III domain-containing protein [Terriglobales bacterium]|nr:fibronectin type III domain-containing protein [Terriglobales bacterium]